MTRGPIFEDTLAGVFAAVVALACLLLVNGCGVPPGTSSRRVVPGRQEATSTRRSSERAGSRAGAAPTLATTTYNGTASLQFAPFTPVDLNEHAGYYDGTAGGISFYYLPLKQIVWGYRVYLYLAAGTRAGDYLNLSLWKRDPSEEGVYYRDFAAQYRPAGGSRMSYYQPDPQTVVVDGLRAGEWYEYAVLPLCVTAKQPFNVDRYQKPFYYGFVPGASLSFIWVDQKTKEWGALQNDGGEATRGYYLVFREVRSGRFQASSSGGGGGGGGELHQ